jgi:oxygen-dependent protoporphyrinogen oxidase
VRDLVKRLVIIGGGIAGLSAAWQAARRGRDLQITLIERDEQAGGKIQSESIDGFVLEGGPDSFLTTRPEALRLCEDLGISDRLIPRTPRKVHSFVMHNHVLSPLPQGFSGMVPMDTAALAASPLLSEPGKRRALEKPAREWTAGDDESVAAFMIRRFGEEAYQLLVEPLVGGIHAGDASLLSRDAILRPPRGSDEPGSGAVSGSGGKPGSPGQPPFLSFPRGTAELVRALEDQLAGFTILRGTRAESVRRHGAGFLVETAGRARHEADALIIATPSHVTARLVASLDSTLREMLGQIPFASTVVIHLAYRRADVAHPLDGYGYLIPDVEHSDLVACTWSSQKWEGRAPSEHVLLRLMAGRFGRRDPLARSDQELFALARGELSATLGITAVPVLQRVHRWERGMPQYTVGHVGRVDAINARVAALPGVFLAGSSYGGVGIPQCVESGARAAAGACAYLEKQGEHEWAYRNRH